MKVLILGFGNVVHGIEKDNRTQNFSHSRVLKELCAHKVYVFDPYAGDEKISIMAQLGFEYCDLKKISSLKIDLVIAALPTSEINSLIEILSIIKFDMLILEKPVSYTKRSFELLFDKIKDKPFQINYQRNWDRGYKLLKQRLSDENILYAHFETTSAIAQSSSHMLELVLQFFPDLRIEHISKNGPDRVIGTIIETGALVVAKKDNIPVIIRCCSNVLGRFVFRGIIECENCRYIFDEGIGNIRIQKKKIGNPRIGMEIEAFGREETLYIWDVENWIFGCYDEVLNRSVDPNVLKRARQVVEIIERVM